MRRDYARLLSRINSPIIYSNTLRSTLVICTLRLNGRRLIFHQRDQLSRAYLGRFSALIARLFIRGSRVTCNCELYKYCTVFAPQPVQNCRNSLRSRCIFSLKSPAPIDVEAPRILMLGRLSPWKGQLQFLHSLVVLRNELENSAWEAEIVGGALFGESDYEDELRAFIAEHELESQVVMRGHLSDVEQCLTHSHILVHASILPEPFGQVIAQGMAAGSAVVAANSGGPLEIIRDHETGLLVDPTKPRDLAMVLDRLLRDADLRQQLGQSAPANRQLGTASVTSPSGFGRS